MKDSHDLDELFPHLKDAFADETKNERKEVKKVKGNRGGKRPEAGGKIIYFDLKHRRQREANRRWRQKRKLSKIQSMNS